LSIPAEHATGEADGLCSHGVPPEASESFAHNRFTEVPQSLIDAARRLAPLSGRLQETLKKLSSAASGVEERRNFVPSWRRLRIPGLNSQHS
jgi:hypothetical protein